MPIAVISQIFVDGFNSQEKNKMQREGDHNATINRGRVGICPTVDWAKTVGEVEMGLVVRCFHWERGDCEPTRETPTEARKANRAPQLPKWHAGHLKRSYIVKLRAAQPTSILAQSNKNGSILGSVPIWTFKKRRGAAANMQLARAKVNRKTKLYSGFF